MNQSVLVFDGFSLRVENLLIWREIKSKNKKQKKEKQPILKGITTRIRAGSLNAIIGPSGAGKTTLLNFLACR